jgi:hypothetical protein
MVEKPQQVPEAVQVEGANPGRNKRQLRVQLSDAVDEGKINIEPPGIVLDAQPPTCGLGRVSSALTSQGRSLVDRCFVVWRLNAACNVQHVPQNIISSDAEMQVTEDCVLAGPPCRWAMLASDALSDARSNERAKIAVGLYYNLGAGRRLVPLAFKVWQVVARRRRKL